MKALIAEGMQFIRTAGRKAGEKVTVVGVKENNMILVKRPNGKEVRCNLRHLMPIKK